MSDQAKVEGIMITSLRASISALSMMAEGYAEPHLQELVWRQISDLRKAGFDIKPIVVASAHKPHGAL